MTVEQILHMSFFCAFQTVVRQTCDASKRVVLLFFSCLPVGISRNTVFVFRFALSPILIVCFNDFASPLMR